MLGEKQPMKDLPFEMATNLLHSPTALEMDGGLWPIKLGWNVAKPNYHVKRRIIPFYSLHFVMEGTLVLTSGMEQTTLYAGDLFCLFPGIGYEYAIAEPDQPLRMFWIAFDGKQSSALLAKIGLNPEKPFARNRINETTSMTQKMMASFFRNSEQHEAGLLSTLYLLFHQLSLAGRPEEDPKQLHNDTFWVQKSMDFMNLHYSENIQVSDVAKFANKERSHFSRTFAKVAGVTPASYLLALKMDKGAELMQGQLYTVTEIALAVGYPDLYSFTRAFKKYFGMPPTRYRTIHGIGAAEAPVS
jgi:AraC-like DNA-binding protein